MKWLIKPSSFLGDGVGEGEEISVLIKSDIQFGVIKMVLQSVFPGVEKKMISEH